MFFDDPRSANLPRDSRSCSGVKNAKLLDREVLFSRAQASRIIFAVKSIFFSYSHKDEALRDQLEVHLAMLKRQGVISTWHDRRLVAGDDVDTGIAKELNQADIILLLASPDFLASDYCYGVEVARALERHAAGQAREFLSCSDRVNGTRPHSGDFLQRRAMVGLLPNGRILMTLSWILPKQSAPQRGPRPPNRMRHVVPLKLYRA